MTNIVYFFDSRGTNMTFSLNINMKIRISKCLDLLNMKLRKKINMFFQCCLDLTKILSHPCRSYLQKYIGFGGSAYT